MSQTTQPEDKDLSIRAHENQARLRTRLKSRYDFIVCGAGASGSVVARRLAENPDTQVLLIEAGGSDEVETVLNPAQWVGNLGSQSDWGFQAQPNPHLNGRTLAMSMGKVLGGGSSVNVMLWARGHRADWDFFASEADDAAWSYSNVLDIYRRIENWQGAPDPDFRGNSGPVWVQPAPDPSPIAFAMLDAARELGIPTFEHPNGRMMEEPGGAAITDLLIRDGRRNSLYRAYVHPWLDRPNLTVLTDTLVRRVVLDGRRATGVEVLHDGQILTISARAEVVLSLGAIHTPKVLMHSGIGDRTELNRFGIPVVQHLPGVGQNLQDHVSFGCLWEYAEPIAPRNNGSEATLYWKSRPELDAPDLLFCQVEFPVPSERTAALGVPEHGWTMFAGLAQPTSCGRLRLQSADPTAPITIDADMMSDPADMKTALACVELCRELGNAQAFRPFVRGETMPGNLKGEALETYIRDSAVTYWHQTCTAKMGHDEMSVVDASLKVYGIDALRVADGSIMPRVTTGNTQAPCAIIGEQAAHMLRKVHGL
ncbi:GMC family oxidoreductase [Roseomonas marmotae]|uniref:GMC family oxidoreductase N-terminal domain-containing protein n=1 Tax=Roseomonas marmotae TaxID=2768161 RepID=A0ABS3KAN8_9PROT|nr:GMC family oxidoreductase N-terminal domain-containing protein [Roseomonas marmotae]MBO1073713.1 GMC family oxidoreductase N-terminal domain-containing protein [Roseomonas marmotae]QTI78650.1 GMC family oxidoreductase N-terminal domain-containing protein [Roseomonas marmotae]